MQIFLTLLGGLIGYAIISSQRDSHVETLKRISENRGKKRVIASDGYSQNPSQS